MIKIRNLQKRYATAVAVDGLNLDIRPGELFGFIGPNGAGKTTTIKMMMGLIKPSSGSITIDGLNVAEHPVEVKSRIGYIPDRPFVYEKLTGMEYLEFIADLFEMDPETARTRALRFMRFFDLEDFAGELIEGYSHGMKQKLIISGALLHNPRLVVVDEPLVGLDPRGARQVKKLFQDLCRQGTTLFMSTHSLGIAEVLCDRVGIIQKGRMVAVGTLDELRRQASEAHGDLEEIFLKLTGDHDLDDLIDSLKS